MVGLDAESNLAPLVQKVGWTSAHWAELVPKVWIRRSCESATLPGVWDVASHAQNAGIAK